MSCVLIMMAANKNKREHFLKYRVRRLELLIMK